MCKYLFKPNDWQEIYVSKATYNNWTTYLGHKIESTRTEKIAIAVLFYSKSRNKYQIIESGYIPNEGYKSSEAYLDCVNKKIELINKVENKVEDTHIPPIITRCSM